MEKLIILKLIGDIKVHGFEVIVEVIEPNGQESRGEGQLPPCPIVDDKYREWQLALGQLSRIKNPKNTISKNVSLVDKIQHIIESRQEAKKRYQDAENSLIEMMNNWLRSESFMPVREILDNQVSYLETARLIVRTSNLQLKKLPWESWEWLNFGNRKVAVSYSSINFVSPPPIKRQSLRIIAVIGQANNLNASEDLQLLQSQLPKNTILQPLVNQSRQQILEFLKNNSCDIFYFAGHSKSEGNNAKIWINEAEYLEIGDLKNTLKTMRLNGLKLAIFNACDGLGLAYKLDEENLSIPNLIVMRDAIHDRAAHSFLKQLIASFISDRLPLHRAVQKAREGLEALEGEFPGSSLQPILITGATQTQTCQDWLEKPIRKRQILKLVTASLIMTSLLSGLRVTGWLQGWEWQVYDFMLGLKKTDKYTEPRLLIVEINKKDTDALQGEYPLKDRTLLKALEKLERYKPNAIGIDLFRDRPQTKNVQELAEYQNLVSYLQNNEHIVPICAHSDEDASSQSLEINPGSVSFVDVPVDADGKIRRSLIAVEPPAQSACQASYSLSAYLALNYLQDRGYEIRFPKTNIWEIYNPKTQKAVRWEGLQPYASFYSSNKTTAGYQMLLNYRSQDSLQKMSRRVSLTEVLKGEIPPEIIEDRIILIGVTDPSLAKDDFTTPYDTPEDREIRGLWLHAHAISQLIGSVEDGRSLSKFLAWEIQILLVWVLCFSSAIACWRFNYLTSVKIIGIILVVLYTIGIGLFLTEAVILPLIPATLALLIPLLAESVSAASSLKKEYSQAYTP
jgi:CHASE2 domain-containing sensor protein